MSTTIEFIAEPVLPTDLPWPEASWESWRVVDFYNAPLRRLRMTVEGTEVFARVVFGSAGAAHAGINSDTVDNTGEPVGPPGTWKHVPIINLAVLGLEQVRAARCDGTSRLGWDYGAEQLHFRVRDGDIEVQYQNRADDEAGAWCRTGYDELVAAWKQFAQAVRAYLQGAIPGLVEHPAIGPWLRGERDEPDWSIGPWECGTSDPDPVVGPPWR